MWLYAEAAGQLKSRACCWIWLGQEEVSGSSQDPGLEPAVLETRFAAGALCLASRDPGKQTGCGRVLCHLGKSGS